MMIESNIPTQSLDFIIQMHGLGLIGKSNVVPTYINGESVQTLLDTGAQISFISKKYARKRGLEIHPIEKLVDF